MLLTADAANSSSAYCLKAAAGSSGVLTMVTVAQIPSGSGDAGADVTVALRRRRTRGQRDGDLRCRWVRTDAITLTGGGG